MIMILFGALSAVQKYIYYLGQTDMLLRLQFEHLTSGLFEILF